jgi:hypothetical protein
VAVVLPPKLVQPDSLYAVLERLAVPHWRGKHVVSTVTLQAGLLVHF